MRRTVAVMLMLTFMLFTTGGIALAQEATPTADYPYPYTPDPADCTVEEVRPVDAFVEIVAQATPVMEEAVSGTVPLGQPADQATMEVVTATVETFIACINAGDRHRAYSYWSDNQVNWLAEGAPIPGDVLRDLLEAPPEVRPAEEQLIILAISSIRVLPDGRVAAFVTIKDDVLPPSTQLFTFAEQDGRWMIDQIMDFIVEGPPVSPAEVRDQGTPAD